LIRFPAHDRAQASPSELLLQRAPRTDIPVADQPLFSSSRQRIGRRVKGKPEDEKSKEPSGFDEEWSKGLSAMEGDPIPRPARAIQKRKKGLKERQERKRPLSIPPHADTLPAPAPTPGIPSAGMFEKRRT